MRMAVFGDIHGHWCEFRTAVLKLSAGGAVDLVLQCGDAKPIRDAVDLEYMHCPQRYRLLGDFSRFHSGKEDFPRPVVLIGGNHEPWNFLDERQNGGELAKNVFFLGRSGVLETGGLRIAGISGVYSPEHFSKPHPGVPYTVSTRRHATYFNDTDINTALALGRVDILLLHEWPSLMRDAAQPTWPANWANVGSEELSLVVEALAPRWVFCGHMHRPAEHKHNNTQIVCLSDFARDPADACIVLDTETESYAWSLRKQQ